MKFFIFILLIVIGVFIAYFFALMEAVWVVTYVLNSLGITTGSMIGIDP